MHENIDNIIEKIYIIQPITRENAAKYKVLQAEAVSLIESAGAAYAGTIYQNIREINAATFVGEGKLQELNERLYGLEGITILFNGELSPSQTLNISAALENRKVIDRTTLILDIFAKNARSGEGKLQVELAQLKYLYPRLKGKGEALSRLGGGVGTRGPGETKLETDRRYIRGRLKYLENRLKETEKRRSLQTARRQKTNVKTIALVGYTNTGKSTLMNLLTGADVYVKNELFATLDPTARSFYVDGVEFLLVDTVGFLQDLPHNLIEAFKSTLESALHCDLALIVCDATGEYDMQLKTTLSTLEEMHFSSPYLIVMNKSETVADKTALPYGSVAISAKEHLGIDTLKHEILRKFREELLFCTLFVPYAKIGEFAALKPLITERSSSFNDDGQTIHAVIPARYAEKFTEFVVSRTEI
ncbi:MAG: GTPase HflX [Clostridiales bacterium]|nr:GTPase HflX [Clostridiales bacterium]